MRLHPAIAPLLRAAVRPLARTKRDVPLRVAIHTALTAALLLPAACGGGGGSGDTIPPITAPPSVTGLALSATTQTLTGVGTEVILQVTLQPSNAVGSVTWSSDNPAVATIAVNGLSATVHAVAAGSARITARVGALEGSSTITVVPILRSVTLSGDTVRLTVGVMQPLVVAVNADAGANVAVTYTSSLPTVATVSTTGVVTAVGAGTLMLTVASVAFPAVTATIPVRVALPTVSVTISPPAGSLLIGASRQRSATVTTYRTQHYARAHYDDGVYRRHQVAHGNIRRGWRRQHRNHLNNE
jgi:hypothetical protein